MAETPEPIASIMHYYPYIYLSTSEGCGPPREGNGHRVNSIWVAERPKRRLVTFVQQSSITSRDEATYDQRKRQGVKCYRGIAVIGRNIMIRPKKHRWSKISNRFIIIYYGHEYRLLSQLSYLYTTINGNFKMRPRARQVIQGNSLHW